MTKTKHDAPLELSVFRQLEDMRGFLREADGVLPGLVARAGKLAREIKALERDYGEVLEGAALRVRERENNFADATGIEWRDAKVVFPPNDSTGGSDLLVLKIEYGGYIKIVQGYRPLVQNAVNVWRVIDSSIGCWCSNFVVIAWAPTPDGWKTSDSWFDELRSKAGFGG